MLIDGKPLALPHTFNASTLSLHFGAMPPATPQSVAAVSSGLATAKTVVEVCGAPPQAREYKGQG